MIISFLDMYFSDFLGKDCIIYVKTIVSKNTWFSLRLDESK